MSKECIRNTKIRRCSFIHTQEEKVEGRKCVKNGTKKLYRISIIMIVCKKKLSPYHQLIYLHGIK